MFFLKNEFAVTADTLEGLSEETVSLLMHVNIEHAPKREAQKVEMVTNRGQVVQEVQATEKKTVGRNDPCPCGSGKKYKNCCLGKDGNN